MSWNIFCSGFSIWNLLENIPSTHWISVHWGIASGSWSSISYRGWNSSWRWRAKPYRCLLAQKRSSSLSSSHRRRPTYVRAPGRVIWIQGKIRSSSWARSGTTPTARNARLSARCESHLFITVSTNGSCVIWIDWLSWHWQTSFWFFLDLEVD